MFRIFKYCTTTYIIVFTLCFLTGCHKDSIIYKNLSFKYIQTHALNQKIPFCIVLIDTSNYLSKEYDYYLKEDYNYLLNSAIYNIVDINDRRNSWYLKWLCPASFPITCIFSSDGRLVDLIPSASKESFLYSEQVFKSLNTSNFHWPNRFNMNKKRAIYLLNNILIQKTNIENGIYKPNVIDALIDSLPYPYSYYLKMTSELMLHDTIKAKRSAQKLINIVVPKIWICIKMNLLLLKSF